jgi:hypothetical protein
MGIVIQKVNHWCDPKLLDSFKGESEVKTTKK